MHTQTVYHNRRNLEYALYMELTKQIGLRLRSARKAQNLSLAALAERTSSLSKSRISNYEQGLRRMGLEEAKVLAAALGTVTATYLLCLENDGTMSEQESALLDYYRHADERGKETILQIAESHADYRVSGKDANVGED
jgi:transcriptional regulator with XRE-family HTH domain